MKNHFKLIFGAILFISAVYCSVMETPQQKAASLVLQNIEALADNEYVTNVSCIGRGSVDCPIGNVKVEYVVRGTSFEW